MTGSAASARLLKISWLLPSEIAEEHGHLAILQRLATEMDDRREHVGGRGENVTRQAEGRLHDHHVGARGGAPFRRAARTQLEVAGIEQRFARASRQQHGRAEDVPGGMQRQLRLRIKQVGLAEGQHDFLALARHPRRHQSRRARRGDDPPMRRQMIEMRVRNKRRVGRPMRIEPKIDLRQINAAAPRPPAHLHLPRHGTT